MQTPDSTLYQIGCLGTNDLLPCCINAKQHLAFMEDVAVCIIQILRIAAIEVPTREADDPSEAVADTDGDTLAEQVVAVSVA